MAQDQITLIMDQPIGSLHLAGVNTPTCICNTGIKGSINGVPFSKNCAPEPTGDLIQQKNPTCWVNKKSVQLI